MLKKNVLGSTILDVRNVLQDQLNRLNQPNLDIEFESKRSDAIAKVANPLIQSAKIEADLMVKNPKYSGTGFISSDETKQIGN